MKPAYFTLLLLTFFLYKSGFAQPVMTKDGVAIGDREKFASDCSKNFHTKNAEINGIQADTKSICQCIADEIIPNIYSEELKEAFDNGTALQLFTREDNWEIFKLCLEGKVDFADDRKIASTYRTDEVKSLEIDLCVRNIISDPEFGDVLEKDARDFCACSIENLYSEGYTYRDVQESSEEDGLVYIEVLLPCYELLSIPDTDSYNSYDPKDIIGINDECNIDVVENTNGTLRIKLSFDGKSKYVIFDTGASEMVINEEIEQYLRSKGTINEQSYVGKERYELADNRIVEARLVVLNNVRIGEFVVNNVTAAIINDASLICGMGLLHKFRDWSFNSATKKLVLYK